MYLRIFYKEKKNLSWLQKQGGEKVKKIEISPKWLVYGFGQPLAISPSFNFR